MLNAQLPLFLRTSSTAVAIRSSYDIYLHIIYTVYTVYCIHGLCLACVHRPSVTEYGSHVQAGCKR